MRPPLKTQRRQEMADGGEIQCEKDDGDTEGGLLLVVKFWTTSS